MRRRGNRKSKFGAIGGTALAILVALSILGGSDDSSNSVSSLRESTTSKEVVTQTEEFTTQAKATESEDASPSTALTGATRVSLAEIPEWDGQSAYVVINGNVPFFDEDDLTTEPFETYSDLDFLGRCGVAYANICIEIMPTEERGEIGSVKPTGWVQNKYDFVNGKYLYNRCHLIGFQLAGENANKLNLITGTRFLNVDGMLPFENMIADYVKETKWHVLYRVTPMFEGDNLLAFGVLMEGYSVEDEGDGICFCVFAYNAQPGVTIDYATGANEES